MPDPYCIQVEYEETTIISFETSSMCSIPRVIERAGHLTFEQCVQEVREYMAGDEDREKDIINGFKEPQ